MRPTVDPVELSEWEAAPAPVRAAACIIVGREDNQNCLNI